jgi:alpha-beta hydrolase superfamily lysophospholipase
MQACGFAQYASDPSKQHKEEFEFMGIADISLVTIESQTNPVVGLLYTPEEKSSQAAVLGHGYSGSKQDMAPLAQSLCSEGYHVFIPDMRGHKLGGTGGYLSSLDDVAEDLETSVRFLKQNIGASSVALCGHSMSGGAAAKTAALCEDVDSLILLAVSLRPPDIGLPPKALKLTKLRSMYVYGAPALEARQQIQIMLREYMGRVPGKPVLLVTGKDDRFNTAEQCQALLDMAQGPKCLKVVNTDHFGVPLRCANEVIEWLAGQRAAD